MNASDPKTVGIGHIGLTVRDLETTNRFFCDCLGWAVVGQRPEYPAAFVSDGIALVTLWQVQEPEKCAAFDRRKNVGLHHLALKVPTLDALNKLYERVGAWPDVNVEFPPEPLAGGPRQHFMVLEPGGLRVEFIFDPAST